MSNVKTSAYSWYNGLTPKWRGVIIFTSLVIATGATYMIIKSVKDKKQRDKDLADQLVAIDDAHKLEEQGMVATFSESQYKSYADEIFAAVNGYGTDNLAITNVFSKMKNDLDIQYLTIAFGVREISSGSWNPAPNYKGGLAGVLSDELDFMEMWALNKSLTNKGITYTF